MNIDKMYLEVDKIEQEISKIYYEIMDADEISPYKNALIGQKLDLLAMKLEGIVNAIIFASNMEVMDIKKKMKRTMILSMIVLVLMFINPLIALPINVYTMYKLNNLRKLLFNEKRKEKEEDFEKQLISIKNMVQNCDTFMNVKTKKRNERLKKEKKDDIRGFLEFDLANKTLGDYLQTGEIQWMPENVKVVLVKMLQDNLHTDEENVDVLLSMARDKMSIESLNNELNLGMVLVKFGEKK